MLVVLVAVKMSVISVEGDPSNGAVRPLEENIAAMFDMPFIIRPRFDNLAVEAGTIFFPPVEDTVNDVPVIAHVELGPWVIRQSRNLLQTQELRVLGVSPVFPCPIGAVS